MSKQWVLRQFLLAVMLCFTAFPAQAELEPDTTAPELSATLFDGREFDLGKAKGKVVVVNFWATWCAACREELPHLSAFAKGIGNRNIEVVALSVDRMDDALRARQAAMAYRLPAAMFAQAKTKFTIPELIPTTYIIDQEGKISARLVPDKFLITQQYLDETVDALLTPKKNETEEKSAGEAKK